MTNDSRFACIQYQNCVIDFKAAYILCMWVSILFNFILFFK